MSDKYTSVETPSGGLGLWGHVSHAEAVAELHKHYERELETAQKVLAAIESGDVHVFHQFGPWAARNRREVKP